MTPQSLMLFRLPVVPKGTLFPILPILPARPRKMGRPLTARIAVRTTLVIAS